MTNQKLELVRFPGILRGDNTGQALVELALTIPLLMLLLLGAVELARAAYAAVEVTNAAEAAVRYGAQNRTTAQDFPGMKLAAQNDASNITLASTTSTRTCGCSDGTQEGSSCTSFSCTDGAPTMETLKVMTTTNFDTLVHLPGLPTTFTLRGYAVQKVLY